MSLVWENYKAGGSRKLTMLALADWCDDNGGSLFPSMAGIARKINSSRSQTRRIVHSFIKAGYLKVVANERGGNPGKSRHYQFDIEMLSTPSMDGTPSMGARYPLHGCALPLAPMTPEPLLNVINRHKEKPLKKTKIEKSPETLIPHDFSLTPELSTWAAKKDINNLDKHLENFILTCKAKAYKYADWNSAFQKAVMADWAKIRQ